MNARFFPATEDYGHYEELPGEPGEHLFPEHPLEPDSFSEGGPPGRPKPGAGVPDFLPSAQRALYLRIQQKQQEEERARRLAESRKQDRENEEGTCPPPGRAPPVGMVPGRPAGSGGACLGLGSALDRSLWPGGPLRRRARPWSRGGGQWAGPWRRPHPHRGGWRETLSPRSPYCVLGKPRGESQSLTQTSNSPSLSCWVL